MDLLVKKYRKEFGKYLRDERLKAGVSQSEVSSKCGYSTSQYISNIERGASWPPMNIMIVMCDIYGVKRSKMLNVFTRYRTKIWSQQMGLERKSK